MINIDAVNKAKQKSPWDLGNKVRYELCERYPYHKAVDEILAKIWLIGGSYSVSIEKRKKALNKGDDFYTKIIVLTLKRSKIDLALEDLSNYRFPNIDNIGSILNAHKYLLNLFKDMSGMAKRSLASKYLHFHKPNLFFIYDSKAMEAIRDYTEPVRLVLEESNIDDEYAKFCLRCINLRDEIKEEFEIHLTPRELDKFLLNS